MSYRGNVRAFVGVAIFIGVLALILWGVAKASVLSQPVTSPVAGPSTPAEQHAQVALAAHPPANQSIGTQSLNQTVDPTPTATPYPPSDNCVKCHTDKAKLQKLAEKPKEVKSEKTSGEG